ncbi:MAG: DUF1559 domain-containing protein [Planctomycetaceae bacterium]
MNPYQSPERLPPGDKIPFRDGVATSKPKLQLVEWAAAGVLVVILAALWMNSVGSARSPGLRKNCRNQMKQIVIALHNYHDDFGRFPPAVVYDSYGRAAHSWRVLLLPYMDSGEIYHRYRFDEPWNGPNNRLLSDFIPDVYQCPAYKERFSAIPSVHPVVDRLTNYVLICGPDCLFDGDRAPQISSVTDGTASTIMLADVQDRAVHWMEPRDITPSELLTELRSTHSGRGEGHNRGMSVGFVDGSVRTILHDTPEAELEALTTICLSDSTEFDF